MQIILFFALFIAILAIIFAVQNFAAVTVSFFIWQFEGSLALVLLVAMATGALISYLFSLPANIKSKLTIRGLRKRLAAYEASPPEGEQPAVEKPTPDSGAAELITDPQPETSIIDDPTSTEK